MDLLLDVNVAVDSCVGRQPWCDSVDLALAKCLEEGGRLWIYVGSVQTLDYVTRAELQRTHARKGEQPTAAQLASRSKALLHTFTEDKHWLSALAHEGAVFTAADPEDEQLLKALERFAPGEIRLLTRDGPLLEQCPDRTISPQAYCQLQARPTASQPLGFIDLKAGKEAAQPQLEPTIPTRCFNTANTSLGPEVREARGAPRRLHRRQALHHRRQRHQRRC